MADLSLCGLGGFAYNSLVHVSSLKIINVDAKMMHIFDAIYPIGLDSQLLSTLGS